MMESEGHLFCVSVKVFGLCIRPEEKETLLKIFQPFGESLNLPVAECTAH